MASRTLWVAVSVILLTACVFATIQHKNRPILRPSGEPSTSTSLERPVLLSQPKAVSTAPANQNQAMSLEDITRALWEGGDQQVARAIQGIRALRNAKSRDLANGLNVWADPLLSLHLANELNELAAEVIISRSFDATVVTGAQKTRLRAAVAQGSASERLVEAKAFYNIVPLSQTAEAAEELARAIDLVSGKELGTQFRLRQLDQGSSQIGTIQNQAEVASEHFGTSVQELATPSGSPTISVIVGAINVPDPGYSVELSRLEGRRVVNGGYSDSNLRARGNLLLLLGRTDEAKACFLEATAASIKLKNGKSIRESLEGIARATRAMAQNARDANELIVSVRENPNSLNLSDQPDPTELELLRTAAKQILLAEVRLSTPSPLEVERQQTEKQGTPASQPSIVSARECGSPIFTRKVSPSHFAVELQNESVKDWLMFDISGAKDQVIRIDLADRDSDLRYWRTLNPVFKIQADSSSTSSRRTFTENIESTLQISGSVAWNGALLPQASQGWLFIPDVWTEDQKSISFVLKVPSDRITIAMRPAFTPSDATDYLASLVKLPNVNVAQIGKTLHGRPISVVEIGEQFKTKPCVLLYAGEHADEPDGSWVATGLIDFLLGPSQEASVVRSHLNFLVIPMLDPDAAAESRHDGILQTFTSEHASDESRQYMKWIEAWAEQGNRIDLVLDLHNVQSAESSHLACALLEDGGPRGSLAADFNNHLMTSMQQNNLVVSKNPWSFGIPRGRFGGWLTDHLGCLTFAYELNCQQAARHLSADDLRMVGKLFAQSIESWMASGKLQELTEAKKITPHP